MPVNRNALIRYKTIDKCLQNYFRRWTLEDLVEACSEALYEYEGISKGVSVRSVQADIQMMRSDKLGYNAPIIVVEKKYYEYEDRKYSITNIPISGADLNKLSESVEFLKQFKGFSHFREIESLIQKLDDHVYTQKNKQKPIIDFDRNEDVKGLEFLDFIYQAILQKSAILITYKTYRALVPTENLVQPYLLKEYKNRWYVVGRKFESAEILNFALDRIVDVERSAMVLKDSNDFDPLEYYKNVIGVSVESKLPPINVRLLFNRKNAPYVITKPIHSSQKVLRESAEGTEISLYVQHNFELEKEILSFGENVKVLGPTSLKRSIKARTSHAADNYLSEISEKQLRTMKNKLQHKSFSPVQFVYTSKEIQRFKFYVDKYAHLFSVNSWAVDNLNMPQRALQEYIFNFNFRELINALFENFFLLNIQYITGFELIGSIKTKSAESLLFCIPLDLDSHVPGFFEAEHSDLSTDRIDYKQKFYLMSGSVLICKNGLKLNLINPDSRNKNCVLVLELEEKFSLSCKNLT